MNPSLVSANGPGASAPMKPRVCFPNDFEGSAMPGQQPAHIPHIGRCQPGHPNGSSGETASAALSQCALAILNLVDSKRVADGPPISLWVLAVHLRKSLESVRASAIELERHRLAQLLDAEDPENARLLLPRSMTGSCPPA